MPTSSPPKLRLSLSSNSSLSSTTQQQQVGKLYKRIPLPQMTKKSLLRLWSREQSRITSQRASDLLQATDKASDWLCRKVSQ
jgi:hypothetical protein